MRVTFSWIESVSADALIVHIDTPVVQSKDPDMRKPSFTPILSKFVKVPRPSGIIPKLDISAKRREKVSLPPLSSNHSNSKLMRSVELERLSSMTGDLVSPLPASLSLETARTALRLGLIYRAGSLRLASEFLFPGTLIPFALFKRGLSALNIDARALTGKTFSQLFAYLDTNKSGLLSMQELLGAGRALNETDLQWEEYASKVGDFNERPAGWDADRGLKLLDDLKKRTDWENDRYVRKLRVTTSSRGDEPKSNMMVRIRQELAEVHDRATRASMPEAFHKAPSILPQISPLLPSVIRMQTNKSTMQTPLKIRNTLSELAKERRELSQAKTAMKEIVENRRIREETEKRKRSQAQGIFSGKSGIVKRAITSEEKLTFFQISEILSPRSVLVRQIAKDAHVSVDLADRLKNQFDFHEYEIDEQLSKEQFTHITGHCDSGQLFRTLSYPKNFVIFKDILTWLGSQAKLGSSGQAKLGPSGQARNLRSFDSSII